MNRTLLRSFLIFTAVAVSIYVLLIILQNGHYLSLTTTSHSHHHDFHSIHTVSGAESLQHFLQHQLHSLGETKQTGREETKTVSDRKQQKSLSDRQTKPSNHSHVDYIKVVGNLTSRSNQTSVLEGTSLNVTVSEENSNNLNKSVTAEKTKHLHITSEDLNKTKIEERNQRSILQKAADTKDAKGVKKSNAAQTPIRSSVLKTAVGARNLTGGSRKFLIFLCNGKRRCGGWGDRQRGLIGMYALALVTNRTFGVIMTEPCNVTHFYTPNQVNWVIPDSELKGKSSITIDDMGSKQGITASLLTMDFNQKYTQDVIYIRTNAEYWRAVRKNKLYIHKLPGWARHSRALYFRTAWRILMKPSQSLQTKFQAFLDGIDFPHRRRPLVGAHVRVGRTSTISTDTTVRCKISDLPVLWNFVDRWVRNGSHVFLATDSMQVRNLTRQRFGDMMYDSGGQIIHVDQQSDVPHACQGFESALLDQLILTRCDVLITSHSIFSQRASYLRGKSENLYSFMHGKITKKHLP